MLQHYSKNWIIISQYHSTIELPHLYCYSDILIVAKAKCNDMGNNMGDIGNDIGDMDDIDNDMDGILLMAIYRDIVEIHDIDIVHSDTSITIR